MEWDDVHRGHLIYQRHFIVGTQKALETLRSASVAPGKSQDLSCLKRPPTMARVKRGVEQESCKSDFCGMSTNYTNLKSLGKFWSFFTNSLGKVSTTKKVL